MFLLLGLSSSLWAQSPDGLYDMDVLNANPQLIQRFPGEVPPGNRTIIIISGQGTQQNISGDPIPTQYQGDLLDFGSPVDAAVEVEVDRSSSFEQTSRRVQRREQPAGPSFSDVARDVRSRGRLELNTPTASRRVRDIQLYDF
jgi:hypothetical protein